MLGLACPNCDYATIDGSEMPEYGRLLADKYRAQHALLTSDEIRGRREQLGMSQQKFADHLGVGIASVKRWEMGKIQDKRSNQLILERTGQRAKSVVTYTLNLGEVGSTVRFFPSGQTVLVNVTLAYPAPMDTPQCLNDLMQTPPVVLTLKNYQTVPFYLAADASHTKERYRARH